MLNVTDVVIDSAATLGKNLVLTEIVPVYAYADGKRTKEILGYRYIIAMPSKRFEKIGVRIDGDRQIGDFQEYPCVAFDNLQLRISWAPSGYSVVATAEKIRQLSDKN